MADLTFLGTGGSYVSQTRACSGIYLQGNLLDCGFGVLTNLRRAQIPLERIDRVFITHAHSDHIGDFTGLIWAMALEGRKKRLEVVSSKEVSTSLVRLTQLQSTPKGIIHYELVYVEPEDSGEGFCTTVHVPTNHAYKLTVDGKTITYTGDTAPCKEVVELATGSDLLIHDSTYLTAQEDLGAITKHSSARQAAGVAREAGVPKLALFHLFPGHQDSDYEREARQVEGVHVIVARDLVTITV